MSAAQAARAIHEVTEPVHTTLYFAADVKAAWKVLGLEPMAQGYVAGRAAPMGRVTADVVAATFFNFSPVLANLALPAAWDIAAPEQVLAARAEAIESLFRRVDAPVEGLVETTDLLATAVAGADLHGRPLASANAAVDLPSGDFARMWQLLTVLREHRGDGHVALLTASGLTPVEVLAVYAAWQGKVSRRFLQGSRVWDDEAWATAEGSLRSRGWLDDEGALTDDGRAWRDGLEQETDRLASRPYEVLGIESTRRLFDLLRPLAVALDAADDVFPRPLDLRASFEG